MKAFKLFLIILAALLFLPPSNWAQLGSTNYRMAGGYAVGGGGRSGSTNYIAVGNVPSGPVGRATSTSYILNGGVGAVIGASAFSVSTPLDPIDSLSATGVFLKVAYSGASGAVTGTIYYRPGGATNYTSLAMTAGTGDTLIAQPPGAAYIPRGIEYYFVLTASNGTAMIASPSNPHIIVAHMTNDQLRYTLPNTSYRIIGVPAGITGGNSVLTVFGDDLGAYNNTQWRLAGYDTTSASYEEYPGADPVVPGRGYWIIARGGRSFGATGYSNRPNHAPVIGGEPGTYEVELKQGWNLIANPFAFQINMDDVVYDDNGVILTEDAANNAVDTVAYAYNGSSYYSAATVPAWNGFFIYAKKTGVSVHFPYFQFPTGSPPKAITPLSAQKVGDGWSLHLEVEANGRLDDGNFAGVSSGAAVTSDGLDFYEPPAAPEAPSLAFQIPGDERALRRTDLRPVFEDGAEWIIKVSPMSGRTVRISGVESIPENMSAVLILDNGSEIPLESDASFALDDGVEEGRLIVGTKEYLEGEGVRLLPTVYSLEQNFPNPFNPSTNIKFALPKSGHVALDIYNILGQKVTTLLNRELPAGYHTVAWDGADTEGRPVASGIYFYKIMSGNFAQNRKMVLLK
ncbi:MAG: FlgD immunoglobulin-like domain containing protein [Candidatus Zixiibacteriota bacterium]